MAPNKMAIIKEALKSTAIWGLLLLALNATIFKEMPLDDALGEELRNNIVGAVDVVGWFMALFGRLTAKKPIITQHTS